MNSRCPSRYVLLTIATILLMSGTIPAQPDADCLRQTTDKIRVNEKLTVEKTDGHEITGRLFSISPSQSILTLYLREGTPSSITLGGDEISTLTYYRTGKVRPLLLIAGTVVGFVGGIYIEELITSNGHIKMEPFKEGEFWHGDIIGAVSGFTLSLIISLLIPKAYHITCQHN